MTTLIIFLSIALISIILVQIGKVSELAGVLRGEKEAEADSTRFNGALMLIFLVLFLFGTIISAYYYGDALLGYGALKAASIHGDWLDRLFDVTLIFTGIVFVLTHIALFWFAYKYQQREGQKVAFISHDNRLEIIWTAIPAVVMTILVVSGLKVWNKTMADIPKTAVAGVDYIEIEATGMQFAWLLRYPGNDNYLGERNYKKITATNQLGQIWEDPKNHDDFMPDKIVLPVNKKVRVRILARDVLHNFYLPHFRVKMDAVPGMPTYFVFTPTKTTEEFRQGLKNNKRYQVPDANDPEKQRWETFVYELACAELCGYGHFSMRREVDIVTQEEYDAWLKEQTPTYSSIKGTDQDTFIGESAPKLNENAVKTSAK